MQGCPSLQVHISHRAIMLKHKNTGHRLSGHSTLYGYYGFKRSEDESKLSKTSLMTDFF